MVREETHGAHRLHASNDASRSHFGRELLGKRSLDLWVDATRHSVGPLKSQQPRRLKISRDVSQAPP